MGSTTSISDTYVDSAHPSTPLNGAPILRLQGSGGYTVRPYLLPKGFATGKDILTVDAYIELTLAAAAGAATWTARRVTSRKAYSDLNYNNQPTNTATGATSQALGALAAGDKIQVDIKDFVDGWAKGTFPNYGIRLDAGATADKRLHSANARYSTFGDARPKLVVEQYRKPSTPQVLGPNGGREVSEARPKLTWLPPTDPLMEQTEYRVEMTQTDGVWATYDSGWVASPDGEHLVTFDIDDGDTWFWRVTIRNGGLQESTVTSSQEFGRTAMPTFTITQPTGGAWTDSTPPVEWTALSAGTQVQFQVRHYVAGRVVVDSGIITGPDTSWTYPKPIPGFDSGEVTTEVRLRDAVDRVGTPGNGVWAVQTATWLYTPGATDPVDSITATEHPSLPVPLVSFERAAGTPDRWDMQRSIDGGPWQSVNVTDGPELHVGGTSYEYVDVTAPPYHDIEYRAVAGSNGIDSSDNPTAEVNVHSTHIWLLDVNDPEFWIAIAGKDDNSLAYAEDSAVFYPKGAAIPQVVFDSFRGWEGTVTGTVYGTDTSPMLGRTAQQMRDAFVLRTKTDPTAELRLILSDQNFPVIVRNATPKLGAEPELEFGISFDAIQVDELPWS
jgi:hypothetical protein